MKLFSILALLFSLLLPALAQTEKLRQGEVLRVWRKGDASPLRTADCRVGDTMLVEVRDFVGWLMDGLDNQIFADDPSIRTLREGSVTRRLIEGGSFHLAMIMASDETSAEAARLSRLTDLLAKLSPATPRKAETPATPGQEVRAEDVREMRQFLAKFKTEKIMALTLLLDHDVLAGVKAGGNSATDIPEARRPKETPDNSYHWLEFRLDVLPANADFWSRIRANPSFRRPVGVTLALNLGTRLLELPSRVEPGTAEDSFDFGIGIIPRWRFASALVLWAFASYLLLRLSGSTDLLRDPDGEIRPDGRRCFSLARSQMACWFLLVIGAYLFLWVVTGNYDTLNDTCLWLIGIGAGTALGAAYISDPKERDARAFPVRVSHEVADSEVPSILKTRLELASSTTDTDPDHVTALENQIAAYEQDFSRKKAFKRLLDDWLRERGLYSFHRYQMLVWTLAMSLIFVVEVWRTLKMPVFNMTALALMGISSGTYLGFKLKDQEQPVAKK